MEILDKKSNRMSRANAGVSERSVLSNELFFTFCEFATAPLFFKL